MFKRVYSQYIFYNSTFYLQIFVRIGSDKIKTQLMETLDVFGGAPCIRSCLRTEFSAARPERDSLWESDYECSLKSAIACVTSVIAVYCSAAPRRHTSALSCVTRSDDMLWNFYSRRPPICSPTYGRYTASVLQAYGVFAFTLTANVVDLSTCSIV